MPASKDVQELFGEGGGAPEPRTALVWSLLVIGLVLSLLGMSCTPAPGAVLVLLSWYLIERENDRIASGYLPIESIGAVSIARRAAFVTVLIVIALFIVQAFLLGSQSYDAWWSRLIAGWLQLAPPAPAPPPAPPAP